MSDTSILAGLKNLTIDDEGTVRLLGQEEFEKSVELSQTARDFVSKVNAFTQASESLTLVLSSQSTQTNEAKKAALGQRVLVQTEAEQRRREQLRMQYILLETKAQTERLIEEQASLQKLIQEQNQIKERLTKST